MPGDASRRNGTKGGRPKGSKLKRTLAREEGQRRALEQEAITAERTMLEIARLAFTDRRGIWRPDGSLKPLDEWTADEASCLEGIEILIKNAAAGDRQTDTVYKVKLATKAGPLELLAKHFGLLTQRVDITHRIALEDVIAASYLPEPDPSGHS